MSSTAMATSPSQPRPAALPGGSRTKALLLLMAFAAIFPEVLSLSTPVAKFLGPGGVVGLLTFLGEYGCGAVLIWEALARWNRGWLSAIPLGAAYGICEEGFATKVFVDPRQQVAIDQLPGAYGRVGPVEWANFVPIDLFHAAVSMGLQLLVIALLFPELQRRSIVGSRGLGLVGAAFAFTIGIQFLFFDPDPIAPLVPGILLLAALAVLLVLVARRLPRNVGARWSRAATPSATPRAFFGLGFAWLLSLLLVFLLGSHLVSAWYLLGAFFLASSGGTLYFLLTRAGWKENRRHQIAFAGGMGGAFLVLDVVFGTMIGDFLAVPFALTFVGVLLALWRRELAPRGSVRPSTPSPS